MAGRLTATTDGYSFRFFSPEQVDQILRDGLRRGREGSHAAIERILKHEPGLLRADLWKRIRQLKDQAARIGHRYSVWGPEDEKVLRGGYENGWRGKRQAVHELLRRHPDWRAHVIWRHAAKLGLTRKSLKRGQERTHLTWSEEDDRTLLNFAGYKTARFIAKLLHRSTAAVRSRLTFLGKSSRAHVEGFSRHALAKDLHLSSSMVQRLIVQGLLEVRDPRITRESLDRLPKSSGLPKLRLAWSPAEESLASGSCDVRNIPEMSNSLSPDPPGLPATSRPLSRAKRVWAEVASALGVPLTAVEQLILHGVLKLYDSTITEKSVRNLCRRHGSIINCDLLSRETLDWLQSTMDFVPHTDESEAVRLAPLRKHAKVVHRCKCGRTIRGNAFFRHVTRCQKKQGSGE